VGKESILPPLEWVAGPAVGGKERAR
jgi:hypothetical protein